MEKEYLYVRAWNIFLMKGFAITNAEVKLAQREDAPPKALYKTGGLCDHWVTYDQILIVFIKRELMKIVNRIRE